MQIQELKRNNPLTKKRQIGRGGARGKTAGRGTKGQKARAGHKIRPEIRDIIKKVPKKRGYRFSSIQTKPVVVNLADLELIFKDNDSVTPGTLVANKVIKSVGRRLPIVKILGKGELTRKGLIISKCEVSMTAAEKIKTAGGKIEK